MVSIANWKYKHGFSNRLSNSSRPHSDDSQEFKMSDSCRGRHRIHDSEQRVRPALQNNIGFPTSSTMAEWFRVLALEQSLHT
jgi:hypothetical protein